MICGTFWGDSVADEQQDDPRRNRCFSRLESRGVHLTWLDAHDYVVLWISTLRYLCIRFSSLVIFRVPFGQGGIALDLVVGTCRDSLVFWKFGGLEQVDLLLSRYLADLY